MKATAKNFLVTSAAVLAALSAYHYLAAPWYAGGSYQIYMGTRVDCLVANPWFAKTTCL